MFFVPKRGHFNGNIAAGVFIWSRTFCESSHLMLFSLRVAVEHFETQRNTSFRSNKDISFAALPQFTVHENKLHPEF